MTLADLVALTTCGIAVVTDVRDRRIPNWLTLGAFAIGLLLAPDAGGLGGAAILFVIFGVPAALGYLGMGDVKLATATGALLGAPLALSLALYTALAGGVVALVYAIRLGASGDSRLRCIPYGVAIAAGCALALVAREVPLLRL